MRTLSIVGVVVVLAAGSGVAGAADTETTPYPGLRIVERRTTSPNQRIWAAYTSLCEAGVSVDARAARDFRKATSTWGPEVGAKLATNGDFYRTDRATPTLYGDAVGAGERWPRIQTGRDPSFAGDWYAEHYGWIAFGDGWVELNHTGYVKKHAAELGVELGPSPTTFSTEIPPGTKALVSGFPELVVEGKVQTAFPDRGDCADPNPRTAMGLSEDRKTFMLVVVDGRSTAAAGMTCKQLAALMGDLGAYDAINLDGGGSTQMWLAGEGTLNNPSDGAPREVSNHWGVFAGGDEPAAHCFTAGGCFPSPIPAAKGARFADLPDDDVAQPALATVVDRGLLAPCATDGREMVCPNCTLTRRDAARMIARIALLEPSATPGAPSFTDVPADDPAFAELEAAHAAGLIDGCATAGGFCPDDAATHEVLEAWVAGALGRDELSCGGDATGPVARAAAATFVVDALDLDGDHSCGTATPGDGDGGTGEGQPPTMGGGGCTVGARGDGAAAWGITLAALVGLVAARRRRG